MRRLLFLLGIIFLASVGVFSQTVTDCPHPDGCVVISRAAAIKSLVDADTVKAQAAQIKVLEQAVKDAQDNTHKMAIEFARVSGEVTALKQNAVSDRAIITAIIPLMRKKCMPFSFCL